MPCASARGPKRINRVGLGAPVRVSVCPQPCPQSSRLIRPHSFSSCSRPMTFNCIVSTTRQLESYALFLHSILNLLFYSNPFFRHSTGPQAGSLPVRQVQKQPRTRLYIPTLQLPAHSLFVISFGLSTNRYSTMYVIPFILSRNDVGIDSITILLAFSCSSVPDFPLSPRPCPCPGSRTPSSRHQIRPCRRELAASGVSVDVSLSLFTLPDIDAWKCRPCRLPYLRFPALPLGFLYLSGRHSHFFAALSELLRRSHI